MISKLEVFKYYKLLKHAGLTPGELWTKSMTMWPDQIMFVVMLHPKMSIRFCGMAWIFLLSYSGLHDKKLMLCCKSEMSVVWCFFFTCHITPFFIQTRHKNKCFSNLAVYCAWVSQLVFCLLPVKRWIFANPWLPPRSSLQYLPYLFLDVYWKETLFLKLLSLPPLFLGGLFLFLFPSPLNKDVLNISLMTVLYPRFFQNMRIFLLNTHQIAIQNV